MGNGISKPKAITPGKYLGYTQGGDSTQLPTLYFENGHLTQEHAYPTNVGWHPLPESTAKHYMANIGKNKAVQVICPAREDEAFIKSIVMNHIPHLKDDDGPFLFEFGTNNGGIVKWHHISRGKFIEVNAPASNKAFSTKYANERVAKAKIADNES